MIRLCVIGNSHLASFKDAWDAMADSVSDFRLRFFGAPARELASLGLRRDLRYGPKQPAGDPETEDLLQRINGATSIDLAQADAVLFVGRRPAWAALAALIAGRDVDGLRRAGARQILSATAFDAILDAIVQGCLPGKAWRNWTTPRLLMMPTPAPSASCLTSERALYKPFQQIADAPDGVAQIYRTCQDRLTAAHRAAGITMIHQPGETLTPVFLTEKRWSVGARRLRNGEPHLENDHRHMNAAYGALCLETVFQALRADPEFSTTAPSRGVLSRLTAWT